MKLRPFEREVLGVSGKAQDILKQFYGKSIGQNNAEKQLAGIRTHLNYLEELDEEQGERKIGEMEETVVKADGTVTTKRLLLLSEEDSKNPTRIMELMGFDILQWSVVSCKIRRNYWDVTMKLAQGSDEHGHKNQELPHTETNHAFECTLSVKPIQSALSTDMITELFDKLEPPELVQYNHKKLSGGLLELPIMDLHLGKLAWRDESGEDWDLNIASELYKKTVTQCLDKLQTHNIPVEKIVFPLGQDFFHFDTSKGATTKGTVMDTDTRWPKLYERGIELAIWAIENLRKIAPVTIIYVAANHDKMMSFFLVKHVEAYFRNCKDVTIKISPYPRSYFVYGKCLIGYSHGADEGKRIDVLMQNECPTFSASKWREWHLGHLHSEHSREVGGIIVRRISSITSNDNWHTEHGYRAVRKAEAFVWDKERGKEITLGLNVMV